VLDDPEALEDNDVDARKNPEKGGLKAKVSPKFTIVQ